ncbi:MAG: glycerate kinase, partial [Actinomycetota bacterium]|nr:glycerate kinase [Actinomycetota bacterium]
RFLLLPDGRAVVESAEAVGLARLRTDELDPLRTSSRGVGELVDAAVAAGASSVIVALGGSATVDGGRGLHEVFDRLPVPVVAACDVQNPLLGPRGAARAFGPQKGASPAEVEELERRLAARDELTPVAHLPGAGAAGGLGAAFAVLGATLVSGIDLVLEAVAFDDRVRGAALVVTGEGAVDRSSLEGKTVAGVLRASGRVGVPCAVFGGRVESAAARDLRAAGAATVCSLTGDRDRARGDLVELGERLARSLGESA